MAQIIATSQAPACTLDQCQSALDRDGFDPADPLSVSNAANWLARLAANRDFLGELALDELKRDCRRPAGQGYSPQVMMLGDPRPGWFMRANIWPSAQEAVLRTSGEAAFVYGLAHDHNFDFLTIGYHGPGYASDHYEVDPGSIIGVAGEKIALRFTGRAVLEQGQVMHYRARRDVHCQFAPSSLSVSINLMHSAPEQRWTDQFQYDIQSSTIQRVLTGCTADTVAIMALALDPQGSAAALESIAEGHPQARVRWSAIQAHARLGGNRSIMTNHGGAEDDWLSRRWRAAISD